MPGFVKTKEDERLWSKAKGIAEKSGHNEDWAYITGIFKKMKGGKVGGMKPNYEFKSGPAAKNASPATTWTVYLFGQKGNILFEKAFEARDYHDAMTKGHKLVQPHVRKHKDAEDWVVEETTAKRAKTDPAEELAIRFLLAEDAIEHDGKAKTAARQNPRAVKHFDLWIIKYDYPTKGDYAWTGSGLKPGYKMWRGVTPKEFPSEQAAVREIRDIVLDHIIQYKVGFDQYITGWGGRRASKQTETFSKSMKVHKTDGRAITLPAGFEYEVLGEQGDKVRFTGENRKYEYVVPKEKMPKTAKSNAKVVEVPGSFHAVKVESPKAKRTEFPFEGYIDFQGLKIDVENVKGSTRSGTGPEGDWSTHMFAHYGEIRDTESTDGDKLDVYVGDNHDSSLVVVIHQHNPWDGSYDEDKVVIGCESIEEAIGLYKKQYDRPGFFKEKEYTAMPIGAFWRWVHDKNNKGRKVTASNTALRKLYKIAKKVVMHLAEGMTRHSGPNFNWDTVFPEMCLNMVAIEWSNAHDHGMEHNPAAAKAASDFVKKGPGRPIVLRLAQDAAKVYQGRVAASKEDSEDYSNKLSSDVISALAVIWKDKIPGGLGDKKKPSDFDQTQLAKGKKVEREHTDDPYMAEEIAMDHLTEDPDYYKKLEKMEKEGSVKPRVMWKKGYTEGSPGAINKAKIAMGNALALLRAISWNYLTSHWQIGGEASYGDHLLFERLYTKTVEETDALAEKLVGTYGIAAVDGLDQARMLAYILKDFDIGCPFERGIKFEQVFQAFIERALDELEDGDQLSLGMDDFLRTMANDHETHLYLLQQRQGGVKMARIMSADEAPNWAKGKKFTHPETKNKVQWGSLPADEQAKLREKNKGKGESVSGAKDLIVEAKHGLGEATKRFHSDGGWGKSKPEIVSAGKALLKTLDDAAKAVEEAVKSGKAGEPPKVLGEVDAAFKAYDKLIWADHDKSGFQGASHAAIGLYDDLKGPAKKLKKMHKTWGKETFGDKAKSWFSKKAEREFAARCILRLAATAITDTASFYAISPEQLYNLVKDGNWMARANDLWGGGTGWDEYKQNAMEDDIRERGGAVFHTGGDGPWDVRVEGSVAEFGAIENLANSVLATFKGSGRR